MPVAAAVPYQPEVTGEASWPLTGCLRALQGLFAKYRCLSVYVSKGRKITITIEALSVREREKKIIMRLEYKKSRRKDNGRQQQSLVSLANYCPYRTLSIFAIYLPAVCNESQKEIYTTTRYQLASSASRCPAVRNTVMLK